MGLGGSLARPKASLSGIALLYDKLAAKWPELLVEMFPRARHIGVLFDGSLSNERELESVQTTATVLGKALLPLRSRGISSIHRAASPGFMAQPVRRPTEPELPSACGFDKI